MRAKSTLMAVLLMVGAAHGQSSGETSAGTRAVAIQPNASLKFEVQRALDRGLAWLEKAQQDGGFWSSADYPALTALALIALEGDPAAPESARREQILNQGYRYLLDSVHDDGIYRKKQLINYNTALGVLALSAAGRPEFKSAILKGRKVLIAGQYDSGQKGEADELFDGGIGYGSSSPLPDMVNTLHALEALYYSRNHAADQPPGSPELNWQAAIQFLQNCQHHPKNPASWVATDPQNAGGFIYSPDSSKAGEVQVGGRTALRAYGSISYAGMLSYIYAGLEADDPRVTAVLDWARANYTLDENPGMGKQGLFFYFHTLTKALSVADVGVLQTTDGKRHHWREEVALRLFDLQQADGSWVNENGRWWEKDPALVTAYAVIALEMIYRSI